MTTAQTRHFIEEGIALLDCKLTDSEKIKFGEEAANARGESEKETENFEALKQTYKGRIGGLEATVNRLLRCVRSGFESRDTKIERYADYNKGVMITVRLDTGEETNERPLTPFEMQGRFQFDEARANSSTVGDRFSDLLDADGTTVEIRTLRGEE